MKFKPEPTLAIVFIAVAVFALYEMFINLVMVGLANFIGPLIGGCCQAPEGQSAIGGQWKAILLGVLALGLVAYAVGGAIGSFNGSVWLPEVVRNAGFLALALAVFSFVWWGFGFMTLLLLFASGFILYKWKNLSPESN